MVTKEKSKVISMSVKKKPFLKKISFFYVVIEQSDEDYTSTQS